MLLVCDLSLLVCFLFCLSKLSWGVFQTPSNSDKPNINCSSWTHLRRNRRCRWSGRAGMLFLPACLSIYLGSLAEWQRLAAVAFTVLCTQHSQPSLCKKSLETRM